MDLSQLLRALGLQQAYQSYQENVGQPFANVAGPFGRGLLGLEKPEYGEEQAYRTGQAVGNMPAVSAPVGAFKAAAQVPGLLADATQAMKGLDLAGLLGLTAYHGSPYRFSKFDPTKIGSGEGAQAYGYGTYFAEAPGVAREYQMLLGGKAGEITTIDGKPVIQLYDQISRKAERLPANQAQVEYQKLEMLDKIMLDTPPNELIKYARDIEANPAVIKWLETDIAPKTKFPGSFYTVDIPDEMIGRMLDWDKPLSQQPDIVRSINPQSLGLTYKKLENGNHAFVNSEGKIIGNLQKGGTQESFAKNWTENVLRGTGSDLYRQLGQGMEGGPKVSSALRQAGIPGIRYLDQGSRGAGQGTRNFVVFPGEEEAIKMLKIE